MADPCSREGGRVEGGGGMKKRKERRRQRKDEGEEKEEFERLPPILFSCPLAVDS